MDRNQTCAYLRVFYTPKSAAVFLCVLVGGCGGVCVDWICSEMHFGLMEANSCLTILQSDVVVGEKGLGRNVKCSAGSPSAMS